MAITPQTYALTATWTSTQLADLWKQMLIDAGLMNDWFDSYTTGSYCHRILRLTNDSQKTYGYQYIWLLFYTSGVYVQFANDWNATTHAPVGTQYLDYCSASCAGSTTNFNFISSLNTNTSYSFVRYTSGNYTFIGGPVSVFIKNGIGTCPEWVDLNKASVFTFFVCTTGNQGSANGWRAFGFCLAYSLKRMVFGGRALAGTCASFLLTSAYVYGGVSTTADVNDPSGTGSTWGGAIRLPSFLSAINPAYAANYSPIVTGIELWHLFDCRLPNDFGFTTTLGLTPALRDQLIVTAGQEVWEVISGTSSGSTNSMCLLARTL